MIHIDVYFIDWTNHTLRFLQKDQKYSCPYGGGNNCGHSYTHHTLPHEDGECEQHVPEYVVNGAVEYVESPQVTQVEEAR